MTTSPITQKGRYVVGYILLINLSAKLRQPTDDDEHDDIKLIPAKSRTVGILSGTMKDFYHAAKPFVTMEALFVCPFPEPDHKVKAVGVAWKQYLDAGKHAPKEEQVYGPLVGFLVSLLDGALNPP